MKTSLLGHVSAVLSEAVAQDTVVSQIAGQAAEDVGKSSLHAVYKQCRKRAR